MPVKIEDQNLGPGPRKLLWALVGILVVYGIVFLGTLIRNNLKTYDYIGMADRMQRTITVEADGKAVMTPNIAVTTIGMEAEAKTVAEAQQKNTTVINSLLTKIQALGVDKKDIQTANYDIYPQYDYKDGTQVLRGYRVSQNVTVKVRDLSKANKVIALAGEVGATNVSGLRFTVDDRDAYKDLARQDALAKVNQKAEALSKALGVRIRSVVTYNEYENTGAQNLGYDKYEATGMGGGPAASPSLEAGTTDVNMHVTVIFEIN